MFLPLKRFAALYLLLFVLIAKAVGQNTDSLEKVIAGEFPDSSRLAAIIALEKYYCYDSREKTLELGRQGLLIADGLNDLRNKAWVLNYMGSAFYYSGMYDSALHYHNLALDIRLGLDDKKGLGASYNNLGNIYDDQGKSTLALDYYLKAMKYFEEIGFTNGVAIVYNSLGNLYYAQKNIDMALHYYLKSLEIQQKLKSEVGIMHAYNNIAIMYDEKKETAKALEYYNRALKMAEQLQSVGDQITGLNNIGQLYISLKEYQKAERALRLSLKLTEGENDSTKLVSPYLNLGLLFKKQKQFDTALFYYQKAVVCAEVTGLRAYQKETYFHIAEVYAFMNNYERAFHYQRMYDEVKDSLFNTESRKQLQELQTKYDTDKKEQQIVLLEKDKTIQRNIRNSMVGIGVLGFILTLVLFFAFRNKQRANKLLAQQKVEILQKNRDLQQKNDLIHYQKKEITDSIEYAQTIQRAMLPTPAEIAEVMPDSFVLFRPKDIVSGDFYWFRKQEGLHFVAAADCTGHGVPGAFMSMIGNDKLNFAVLEKKMKQPGEILSELNKGVKAALKQGSEGSTSRDGMDIALCVYDPANKQLQYAGANRTLYRISKGELTEYAPSKSAIAGFTPEDYVYNNITVDHEPGDLFYIFTDGYADQFGGEDKEAGKAGGKKMMVKNFKKLLLAISHQPMDMQREELSRVFDKWKGDFEQIDDVLVIGFRLG